jgi:phosphoribosylformylglycinamidine synthase
MSTPEAGPAASFRFAVNVTPKEGILDPQGRAVEQSLPHLGLAGITDVRVGRRVEMSVQAADIDAARAVVDRLASGLLSNPLIEQHVVEVLGGASSATAERGPR